MRRLIVILAGFLVGVLALSGVAAAVPVIQATITDQQYARSYRGASTYSGGWMAQIGDDPPFGTNQKIDVGHDGGDFYLKIHSPFTLTTTAGSCPGPACAEIADIALSVGDLSLTTFEYGISLGKQGKAVGLYDSVTWKTSYDLWKGTSGWIYGGKWDTCTGGATCANPKDADVQIASGNLIKSVDLNQGSGYLEVWVRGWLPTEPFSIFWGTADCNNDPIFGVIETGFPPQTVVPEPGTLALLGTGLVGLGAMLRRRARRATGARR